MKIDKWPSEIECEGYRWTVDVSEILLSNPPKRTKVIYERKEKLYVPPSMKEIMNHLVSGGWVKVTYDYTCGAIYIRLKADGKGTEYFDTSEMYKEWQGHNIDALFWEHNGKKELIAPYPDFKI